MISAFPLACLVPFLAGAQPSLPPGPSYQERPQQVVSTPRDGLPDALFYDSAELMARSNFVGTWKASYVEHGGTSRPDIASGVTMKFTRGRIEMMQRGRPTIVVAYNVIPSKTPAGIVWSLPSTGEMTYQDGVYYLEGDTLVFCMAATNAPAATQFVTLPGDGKTLFVLQRNR